MDDHLGNRIASLLATLVNDQRELVAEIRQLRADLARPSRGAAVDSESVETLLIAIADVTEGRKVFSVSELLLCAESAPALRAAIEAAGITNGKRLGKLLARIEGQSYGGLRIQRVGSDAMGALWVCGFPNPLNP